MTNTQRFIELAIEGGAIDKENKEVCLQDNALGRCSLARVLLEPLVWQAVGKAKGWRQNPSMCTGCQTIGMGKANHMQACPEKGRPVSWNENWHRFIDLLADGRSLEDALGEILK